MAPPLPKLRKINAFVDGRMRINRAITSLFIASIKLWLIISVPLKMAASMQTIHTFLGMVENFFYFLPKKAPKVIKMDY